MSKQYCFGVDLGSNNVIVGRTVYEKDTNLKSSVEIVGDKTDTRIIPNRVLFPLNTDVPRLFGNDVMTRKAHNFDCKIDDIKASQTFNIHGEQHNIPLFVAKNSIVSHIKDVINFRSDENDKQIKTVVFTQSTLDNPQLIYAEKLGIESVFRADAEQFKNTDLLFINDVNALIMSYVQKYVMSTDYEINKLHHVVILDVGYSQIKTIRFIVEKQISDKTPVVTIHQTGYSSVPHGTKKVDDAFIQYVYEKVASSHPQITIEDIKYNIDQVLKLKHQLSINKSISLNLQGAEYSINMMFTSSELDAVIESSHYDEELISVLNDVLFDDKTENQSKLKLLVLGGGSRMQKVTRIINSFCESNNVDILRGMNPDEAVAEGATFYGWYVNNRNIVDIIFTRHVRNNVDIHFKNKRSVYNGNDDYEKSMTVFQRGRRIVSLNNVTDRISVNDHTKYDPGYVYDKVCLTIDSTARFDIVVRNKIKFMINIKNHPYKYLSKFSDKYKYMQITLQYNFMDVVDILEINCDGVLLDYDIYCISGRDDVKDWNVKKLITEGTEIEEKLIETDKYILSRHEILNYMEEYYNSKSQINSILAKYSNITVDTPFKNDSNLPYPIKELYEFYQFCASYIEEDQDGNYLHNAKHNFIEKLLYDRQSVDSLIEAIKLIEKIKKNLFM